MLHPAQVWGCCYASPGQGETFPYTPDSTTAAPTGSEPNSGADPSGSGLLQAIWEWILAQPPTPHTSPPFHPSPALPHTIMPPFLLTSKLGQRNSPHFWSPLVQGGQSNFLHQPIFWKSKARLPYGTFAILPGWCKGAVLTNCALGLCPYLFNINSSL